MIFNKIRFTTDYNLEERENSIEFFFQMRFEVGILDLEMVFFFLRSRLLISVIFILIQRIFDEDARLPAAAWNGGEREGGEGAHAADDARAAGWDRHVQHQPRVEQRRHVCSREAGVQHVRDRRRLRLPGLGRREGSRPHHR